MITKEPTLVVPRDAVEAEIMAALDDEQPKNFILPEGTDYLAPYEKPTGIPPEERHVDMDDDERQRLLRRGRYRNDSYYFNDSLNSRMTVGPECQELYPWLMTDHYAYDWLLASVELREMIASSTLAVLDDAEKFTTIVGEDTSGRIAALIVAKAMNIVRELKGLSPARRLFVSGRIDESQAPNFRAHDEDDRALLVTEYVCTGDSVNGAADALRQAGFMAPSVLTLDRHGDESDIYADKVYMGARNTYTGRADDHLYGLSVALKGVTKESGDAHSSRASLSPGQRQHLIKLRADIDHFAHELVGIWLIRQREHENEVSA
jgi:hypothetical protein